MNYKTLIYTDRVLSEEPIEITEQWWKETMNHQIMSRLRFIKQVGNGSLVFHGAQHTRFEHSAGVGLLTSKFLPKNAETIDRTKAIFSGLCHDLGHGPFSHSFEKYILPGLGIHGFKHEDMSVKLAEFLHSDLSNPPFDATDFKEIFHNGRKKSNNELYFLISNKASGFDMDRLDYIRRDCLFTGQKVEVNWPRLLSGTEWAPDFNGKKFSLSFKEESVKDLGDMLRARAYLFESLYYHPRSAAMDLMIADLIIEGNHLLKLEEHMQNPLEYISLNDSIVPFLLSAKNKSKTLEDIANRIKQTDLYEYCGSWNLPKYSGQVKFSKREIKEFEQQVKTQIVLALDAITKPKEIEVSFFKINGMMDCHFDQILVKMKNDSLLYFNETKLDYSLFDSNHQHYCIVFSKSSGKAEAIVKTLEELASKSPNLISRRNFMN